MEFRNPFNNNNEDKKQMTILKDQQAFQHNADVISNELHPQNADVEMFQQKENVMAELTRWQQDLSPTLKILLQNLAGLYEDEEGRLKKIAGFKAVCNYVGAKRMIDFIKPIDKNVMNGAWSIKQINDSMIATISVIIYDIKEHFEEYGIEYSVATFNYIKELIINSIYPTFLRGLENGERKYHGQIQKVIETKNILPEKKKDGIFGKS